MRDTGLIVDNLIRLCTLAGLEVLAPTSTFLPVKFRVSRVFKTPSGVINDALIEYEKNLTKDFEDSEDLRVRELVNIITNLNQNANQLVETLYFSNPIPFDKTSRINKSSVTKALQAMNLKIIAMSADYVIVTLFEKPSEVINGAVDQDRELAKDRARARTDEIAKEAEKLSGEAKRRLIRAPIAQERSDLIKASEYVTAETDGSNLKELFELPFVDKTRTVSSNIFELASVFGIENARAFLLKALKDVVDSSGSYVHPTHIVFVAEFITNRGYPYGATYLGISRQPGGHLSLATLERASKVFSQSALHGKDEDIRGVSASIVVGTRSAIGDGTFDIGFDVKDNNGNVVKFINDEVTKYYSDQIPQKRREYKKAARALGKITSSGLEDQTDAAIDEMSGFINTFDNYADEKQTDLNGVFKAGDVMNIYDRDVPKDTRDELNMNKVGMVKPEPKSIPISTPISSSGIVTDDLRNLPTHLSLYTEGGVTHEIRAPSEDDFDNLLDQFM
jgi:RNA polymerase Rpb1